MNLIATQSANQSKFIDPHTTLEGKPRAHVTAHELTTLWFNTGTLCNLTCHNCYIESSPSNDSLTYLTTSEVTPYLQEVADNAWPVHQVGITGGEPFMNPEIISIMHACLARGYGVVVLTNAMRPMMKQADALLALNQQYGEQLTVRVSIDHHERELHEEERGPRAWQPMVEGLQWLANNHFRIHIAGRTRWGDNERSLRQGFAKLFNQLGVQVDAQSEEALTLFPEMDPDADVPEITTDCWRILKVAPTSMMCASSRMVVKHKGAKAPEVVACTLLPYDSRFSLGATLKESLQPISLNHPHCARFCVLGGGSCSGATADE